MIQRTQRSALFGSVAAVTLMIASLLPNSAHATPEFQDTGIASAINDFGPDLVSGLIKNDRDDNDNVVVSPLNVTRAMIVLMAAADGPARAEMARIVFGFSKEMSDDEINKQVPSKISNFVITYNNIIASLGGQVKANSAIGVWANSTNTHIGSVGIQDGFTKFIKEIDGEKAIVESLDFTDPATEDAINKWADNATEGDITEIVKGLESDDAAVMALALMVEGKWIYRFGDKDTVTQQGGFKADDGSVYLSPMMKIKFGAPTEEEQSAIAAAVETRKALKYPNDIGLDDDEIFKEESAKFGIHDESFKYMKGKDFEAFKLPLGKDAQGAPIDALIIKPAKGTAAELYQTYAAQNKPMPWLNASGYQEAHGTVQMPRIDLEDKSNLKKTLAESFKASSMFGTGVFTNMFANPGLIYLSKLTSFDRFKADETGAKASSVVVAEFTSRSMSFEPEILDVGNLTVDRSFITTLQHRDTGISMFESVVSKPNNEMLSLESPKEKGPEIAP